jgi:uncharacterized protein (TIGR02996 family)
MGAIRAGMKGEAVWQAVRSLSVPSGTPVGDDSGAALQVAIEDDPDDPSTYSVLGDWLQRRGDPRGELIALCLAADVQRTASPRTKPPAQVAIEKLLARHSAALLGRLARYVPDPIDPTAPPFLWRRGYIARAELAAEPARPVVPILRELLRHPSGRFLRELSVRTNGEGPEILELLAAAAPRSLRELELYGLGDLGDLGTRWEAFARLHRLSLTGRTLEVGALELPTLQRARFAASELSSTCVRSIVSAPFPRLERLELRFGSSGGNLATFEDLRPLLHRTDLPVLTHLRLHHAPYAGAIVRELVGAALARQLVVLDLSHGKFDAGDIEFLVRYKKHFAQLRELWLPLRYLRSEAQRRAMKITKSVVCDEHRPLDHLEDEVRRFAVASARLVPGSGRPARRTVRRSPN